MKRKGNSAAGRGLPSQGEQGRYQPDPYSRNGNQRLAVERLDFWQCLYPCDKAWTSCYGRRANRLDLWLFMRPYGIWTCADDREVVFNRDYQLILERYPGQPYCRAANPSERVEWIEQRWFYKDSTPLKHILMNAALAEWGLPKMPPMPLGNARSSSCDRRKWPNPYERIIAAM